MNNQPLCPKCKGQTRSVVEQSWRDPNTGNRVRYIDYACLTCPERFQIDDEGMVWTSEDLERLRQQGIPV